MTRAVRRVGSMATLIALLTVSTTAAPSEQSWTQPVAEAIRLHDQGKLIEAIALLRKARAATPALPPIHQLQLVQYLTEQVMESPALPRADAQRLLDEARAITEELVARKQEVRLALMAKSLVIKTQADREPNAARKQTLLAESERTYEQGRWVQADGSPVVKTVEDEWQIAQGKALVRTADGKEREDIAVYEKFIATHPGYAPAHLALARHHERTAAEIIDRTPKSVATRTRHLQLALSHFQRAAEAATDATNRMFGVEGSIAALGPEGLNRVAEAEALARDAVKKDPHPALVMRLLKTILPTASVATDAGLRSAREAIPATAEGRHTYGIYLWDIVYRNRDLPRESQRRILAESVTALDGALKLKPDYYEALMYKAVVLKLQAERVEQDPARIKALTAEADRLLARAKQLQNGKRPTSRAER